ncbi:hypothetical protein HGRIS_000479 [Hohenbuehelia grisea]|uniref:Uncharacterized protein n=1 Tax=Hohenbuehelia grisea TaxID=104357 RepID=A0ABR3JRB7_9AGAR
MDEDADMRNEQSVVMECMPQPQPNLPASRSIPPIAGALRAGPSTIPSNSQSLGSSAFLTPLPPAPPLKLTGVDPSTSAVNGAAEVTRSSPQDPIPELEVGPLPGQGQGSIAAGSNLHTPTPVPFGTSPFSGQVLSPVSLGSNFRPPPPGPAIWPLPAEPILIPEVQWVPTVPSTTVTSLPPSSLPAPSLQDFRPCVPARQLTKAPLPRATGRTPGAFFTSNIFPVHSLNSNTSSNTPGAPVPLPPSLLSVKRKAVVTLERDESLHIPGEFPPYSSAGPSRHRLVGRRDDSTHHTSVQANSTQPDGVDSQCQPQPPPASSLQLAVSNSIVSNSTPSPSLPSSPIATQSVLLRCAIKGKGVDRTPIGAIPSSSALYIFQPNTPTAFAYSSSELQFINTFGNPDDPSSSDPHPLPEAVSRESSLSITSENWQSAGSGTSTVDSNQTPRASLNSILPPSTQLVPTKKTRRKAAQAEDATQEARNLDQAGPSKKRILGKPRPVDETTKQLQAEARVHKSRIAELTRINEQDNLALQMATEMRTKAETDVFHLRRQLTDLTGQMERLSESLRQQQDLTRHHESALAEEKATRQREDAEYQQRFALLQEELGARSAAQEHHESVLAEERTARRRAKAELQHRLARLEEEVRLRSAAQGRHESSLAEEKATRERENAEHQERLARAQAEVVSLQSAAQEHQALRYAGNVEIDMLSGAESSAGEGSGRRGGTHSRGVDGAPSPPPLHEVTAQGSRPLPQPPGGHIRLMPPIVVHPPSFSLPSSPLAPNPWPVTNGVYSPLAYNDHLHRTPTPQPQQPHRTPTPQPQQPHRRPTPQIQQPHHTPTPQVQPPHRTPTPQVRPAPAASTSPFVSARHENGNDSDDEDNGLDETFDGHPPRGQGVAIHSSENAWWQLFSRSQNDHSAEHANQVTARGGPGISPGRRLRREITRGKQRELQDPHDDGFLQPPYSSTPGHSSSRSPIRIPEPSPTRPLTPNPASLRRARFAFSASSPLNPASMPRDPSGRATSEIPSAHARPPPQPRFTSLQPTAGPSRLRPDASGPSSTFRQDATFDFNADELPPSGHMGTILNTLKSMFGTLQDEIRENHAEFQAHISSCGSPSPPRTRSRSKTPHGPFRVNHDSRPRTVDRTALMNLVRAFMQAKLRINNDREIVESIVEHNLMTIEADANSMYGDRAHQILPNVFAIFTTSGGILRAPIGLIPSTFTTGPHRPPQSQCSELSPRSRYPDRTPELTTCDGLRRISAKPPTSPDVRPPIQPSSRTMDRLHGTQTGYLVGPRRYRRSADTAHLGNGGLRVSGCHAARAAFDT